MIWRLRAGWSRFAVRAGWLLGRLVPRWVVYWIVIREAAATSAEHPRQEVGTITWDQMAERIEGARGTR